MMFDLLDVDEILALSVAAISDGRQAEALALLKHLHARDPANDRCLHLIAAQHAQIGLKDRAETEFRALLQRSPGYAIARFQYGQLLMGQDRCADASDVLGPLLVQEDDLARYSRALVSAGDGNLSESVNWLDAGLALLQSNDALATDMRALRDRLAASIEQSSGLPANHPETPAPMFLTGYGRSN